MHKIASDLPELIDHHSEFPFIICVALISMIGVYDLSVRDYFIIRIKKGKITKTKGNVEIMEMSNHAKRQFLSSLSLFEVTRDNKDGKVYELKGTAGYFKSKIKTNKSTKRKAAVKVAV